jgi:hypothetical protein
MSDEPNGCVHVFAPEDFNLTTAWDAFAGDMERHGTPEARVTPSFRKAFKTGAEIMVVHGLTHGYQELIRMHHDQDHAYRVLAATAALQHTKHPDWGDLHDHAYIAGGFAILAMIFVGGRTPDRVCEDISEFVVPTLN